MKQKTFRLWSKSESGQYLFCTCDCDDYRLHSDVQQSREEFDNRWRNTVQPGEWGSIGKMGDYPACLFGRSIGLQKQTLAPDGSLAWHNDGSRHMIIESHKQLWKLSSKSEAFEASVNGAADIAIDSIEPSESGKRKRYTIRTFHEVVATLNHCDVTLWCCKHIIVAARFLFSEKWPDVPCRIGWGLALEDTVEKLMLNGQVAVAAMPGEGF